MTEMMREIPVLENGHILIVGLEESDAPGLQRLMDNPVVYRYLPSFLAETRYANAREMISRIYEDFSRKKNNLILGIRRKESGEFCGLAEFYDYDPDSHTVHIGYRLDEPYWGKGIAGEAVGLMCRYLFENTDVSRICACVMEENIASGKVLEKNGFVRKKTGVPEEWGNGNTVLTELWERDKRIEQE